MHRTDIGVILVFSALLWAVLGFTLKEVLGLVDSLGGEALKLGDGVNPAAVKAIIIVSALVAGAFATAAMVAVLVQLHRNRDSLYCEDISHLDEPK